MHENDSSLNSAAVERRFGKSKLARHGPLVLRMKDNGYSYRDLAAALANGTCGQKVTVSHVNIKRFLGAHGVEIREYMAANGQRTAMSRFPDRTLQQSCDDVPTAHVSNGVASAREHGASNHSHGDTFAEGTLQSLDLLTTSEAEKFREEIRKSHETL